MGIFFSAPKCVSGLETAVCRACLCRCEGDTKTPGPLARLQDTHKNKNKIKSRPIGEAINSTGRSMCRFSGREQSRQGQKCNKQRARKKLPRPPLLLLRVSQADRSLISRNGAQLWWSTGERLRRWAKTVLRERIRRSCYFVWGPTWFYARRWREMKGGGRWSLAFRAPEALSAESEILFLCVRLHLVITLKWTSPPWTGWFMERAGTRFIWLRDFILHSHLDRNNGVCKLNQTKIFTRSFNNIWKN